MKTRHLVAAAAFTLVLVAVAAAVIVGGREPRPGPTPVGALLSESPVLYRPGIRVGPAAPPALTVLRDPTSYVGYAAFYDTEKPELARELRRLAGASPTGHLVFHRSTRCDSVSGPQLRADGGRYLLAFAGTVHHDECYAWAEALVVFVNPAG